MLKHLPRIDMTLTDEHVLVIIKRLLPGGQGQLTYPRIAEEARCHPDTVFRATRRLRSAGRIRMSEGSGRRAVNYEIIEASENDT